MKSLLVLFIFTLACSSRDAYFKKRIKEKKCELAAFTVPGFKRTKVEPNFDLFPKALGGYILRNTHYESDLTYLVEEGIILPIVACTPVILLPDQKKSTDVKTHERCFSKVHDLSRHYANLGIDLNLGAQVFEKTEAWKCPDFSNEVKKVEDVASCYERRGETVKARKQLLNLIDPKSFGGCVEKSTEESIVRKLIELEKKLRRLQT
jgi:hypothetical protein